MAIQADRAVGRSENPWGGTSNVVVIICLPLGWKRVNWSAKIWMAPPCLPDSYGPGWRQNDFPVTTFYTMQNAPRISTCRKSREFWMSDTSGLGLLRVTYKPTFLRQLGGTQLLRGPNFTQFWPPTFFPWVDNFEHFTFTFTLLRVTKCGLSTHLFLST